jgi:outer membrane murein-binding lipoprotein Lpp
MEGTVGAPPQRVCPRCARISWAAGPRCPYCRARFRRTTVQTVAWMLAAAVVVVLAGVALMLYVAGRELRSELDDRAGQIQRELDASVAQLRKDVNADLDQRLPATTPTPVPTPTPTASPSPTPSPSPTATPGATATPRSTSTTTPLTP